MARVRKPTRRGKAVPLPAHDEGGFAEGPIRSAATRLLVLLEQRTEQLGLVNGVLRTIVSGATITEILRVFAANLKTLCPFDRCSISVYDEKRRVFHVPWMVVGGRVLETHEPPRPYAETILSKVIETREPLLRRDLKRERARFASDTDFLKRGFRCEMLFPLQVGDHAFGTFNIGTYEADRITQAHFDLVKELVPAVAVAVWQHLSQQKFVVL